MKNGRMVLVFLITLMAGFLAGCRFDIVIPPSPHVPDQDDLNFIASKNLIAYFPLDNDTLDHGPSNFSGINYGANPVQNGWNQSNQAYQFNANAYIISSSDYALGTVSNSIRTYCLWFIASGSNAENALILISKFRGFSYTNENFAINLSYKSAGNNYRIMVGGNTGIETTVVIEPNTLYHLAAVFNPTNSTIKVYLNGVLRETVNVSLNTYPCNEPFIIGAYYNEITGQYFSLHNGMIDNVRIYDGELSAEEINKLYTGHY